jgi:ribosomal protein S18 acetylase RimI-like enzyme
MPISRRPATDQDDAFLFELFKTTRAEFANVLIPPAQLDSLMRMQHAAQTNTYTQQYAGDHEIILLDGNPIGRIWVWRGPNQYRLVDISILPDWRNRGIGSDLLRETIGVARAAGLPLGCAVATNNPGSLRFHQRLGFRVVSQDELQWQLVLDSNGGMPPFSSFLMMVLRDNALRDELLQAPDLPALTTLVLERARQRGLNLTEPDLQTVISANRSSWMERWLDR